MHKISSYSGSKSKKVLLNIGMMVLIALVISAYANSILYMRACPGRPGTFLELVCTTTANGPAHLQPTQGTTPTMSKENNSNSRRRKNRLRKILELLFGGRRKKGKKTHE